MSRYSEIKRSRVKSRKHPLNVQFDPMRGAPPQFNFMPPSPFQSALFARTKIPPSKPEKKYNDTVILAQNVTKTGTVNASVVNAIPTGTTSLTRIGDTIQGTEVYFKGMIQPPSSPGDQKGDIIRVCLVYSKATNMTAPTITQLFSDVAPTALSLRKLENAHNFIFLYDKVFKIKKIKTVVGNEMTADQSQRNFRGGFKLPKDARPVHFRSSGATDFTDFIKGALFWVYISELSDGITAGQLGWRITLSTRYRFTDL